jgi:hypothetical protein
MSELFTPMSQRRAVKRSDDLIEQIRTDMVTANTKDELTMVLAAWRQDVQRSDNADDKAMITYISHVMESGPRVSPILAWFTVVVIMTVIVGIFTVIFMG